MVSFYIDQILFVLITFLSVKEEVNGTWAFREYAAPGTIQSKLYHSFGAKSKLITIFLAALAFKTNWVDFALLATINGFIYWLLFDIWYNIGIKQKWDYLGNEAATDKTLKKIFGQNAGRNKAYFCILVIIILNVIKFFI